MKKIICLFISFCLVLNINLLVYAETDANSKVENNTEISTHAEEAVENILDEFNNNSDELQEKVDDVIEKNSDNFIVKLFKSIIDAISKFLDAIFELALEITKIR